MVKVIVVPETDDFKLDVSHENVVWINKKHGIPRLEEREVRYLAPFWLGENEGVNRIYHIRNVKILKNATEITLGNSFIVENKWNEIGQRRKFEYHPLSSFGYKEITPGLIF